MISLFRVLLVIGCVMTSLAAAEPIRPKVVVVAMFEAGADSGDRPGEFQYWVEREALTQVLPFPQGFRDLRTNADGSVLGVVTGVGTAKSAATIMALGLDPRFDLSKSYWLVAGIAGIDTATVFFDVNVAMLFVAFVVVVIATALTVKRRPWDAAMVALAPTMILGATINWDLIPLALIGLALLAWSRRHPFAAGLILGLAIAAKFYPIVLLGGFLLLSLRSAKWRALGMLLLGSAASWLAVNLPFMVANPEGWSWFYRFSQERGEDFGSLWYALNLAGIAQVPAESLNTWATGLFLVLCVGIAALVLAAPRRPRLAAVLFLIVVAFVLTNKVYSPQYSLWLIPLAVMARPRWTSFLIWQAGEVIYFVAIWWYLAGYGVEGADALQGPEYAVAILVRMLATLYLAALVVQDMLVPSYDPVRSDGEPADEDDPGGGVYDGADDRFTLRRA